MAINEFERAARNWISDGIGPNLPQRELLIEQGFVIEAWNLSTSKECELWADGMESPVAADLLEENGWTEHAKLFRGENK